MIHFPSHVHISTESLRNKGARWETEVLDSKKGWRGTLEMIVDSQALEVTVGICVGADLVLTLITFIVAEEVAESFTIFFAGAILLLILLADVLLRVAKDGRIFFTKPLNWVEFIVAVGSTVMLGMAVSKRTGPQAGASSGGKNPSSLGRAIRPALRMFRVFRGAFQLCFARGGAINRIQNAADKITERLIRGKLTDLFLVPSTNMDVSMSKGLLHLEKAQIKSSVFLGLHLPFTILGGIIDLAHINIDLSDIVAKRIPGKKAMNSFKKSSASTPSEVSSSSSAKATSKGAHGGGHAAKKSGCKLVIVVDNVLLVLGPGPLSDPTEKRWRHEDVMNSKVKLIDLMTKRAEDKIKPKKAGKSNETKALQKKKQKNAFVTKMKARVMDAFEEVVAHGMNVCIRNFEIRFEDAMGTLTGGRSTIGCFQVGHLELRASAVQDQKTEVPQDNSLERNFRAFGDWKVPSDQSPGFVQLQSGKSSSSATGIGGGNKLDVADKEEAELQKAAKTIEKKSASGMWSNSSRKQQQDQPRKGVRCALELDRVCAFLDILPWKEERVRGVTKGSISDLGVEAKAAVMSPLGAFSKGSRLSHYAWQVQENSLVDIVKFLRHRQRWQLWERARLAVCTEIVGATSGKDKTCPLANSRRCEQVRVLRERMAAHKYLLFPCSCTVHGLVKRVSPADELDKNFWPVGYDFDVVVPELHAAADLEQMAALNMIAKYMKAWNTEDKRMQWFPQQGGTIDRWAYALRQVLMKIDPKFRWNSLAWIELRRRSRIKKSLVEALTTGWQPDDSFEKVGNFRRIGCLQVNLSTIDIVDARTEAAQINAAARLEAVRQKRKSRFGVLAGLCHKSETADDDVALAESDQQDIVLDVEEPTSPQTPSKSSASTETSPSTGGLGKAFQVRISINLTHATLLTPPLVIESAAAQGSSSNIAAPKFVSEGSSSAYVSANNFAHAMGRDNERRAIIKCHTTGIVAVITQGAPESVWFRFCPPDVAGDVESGAVRKGDLAIAAMINEMGVVLAVAPPNASRLRRMVGLCGKRPRKLQTAMQQSQEKDKEGESNSFKGDPVIQIRIAKVNTVDTMAPVEEHEQKQGIKNGGMRPTVPELRVAVCFPGQVEVNIIKPLIKVVKDKIMNPLPKLEAQKKHSQTHEFRQNCADIANGKVDLQFLHVIEKMRENHTLRRVLIDKKARKAEKQIGIAGPLKEIRVRARITFVNGANARQVEVYTKSRWLDRMAELPPGVMELSRGGTPPMLKTGYIPGKDSMSKNSHGVTLLRLPSGWWCASEAEVAVTRDRVQRDWALRKSGTNDDMTCAGNSALELEIGMMLEKTPFVDHKRYVTSRSSLGVPPSVQIIPETAPLPPEALPPALPLNTKDLPEGLRELGQLCDVPMRCCDRLELREGFTPRGVNLVGHQDMSLVGKVQLSTSSFNRSTSPCHFGTSTFGQVPQVESAPISPQMKHNGIGALAMLATGNAKVQVLELDPSRQSVLVAKGSKGMINLNSDNVADIQMTQMVVVPAVIGLPAPTLAHVLLDIARYHEL